MTPFTLTTTKQNLSDLIAAAGYSVTALAADRALSLIVNNKGSADVYITTRTDGRFKPNAGNGYELGLTLEPNTSTTIELRNIGILQFSAASTNASVEILAI